MRAMESLGARQAWKLPFDLSALGRPTYPFNFRMSLSGLLGRAAYLLRSLPNKPGEARHLPPGQAKHLPPFSLLALEEGVNRRGQVVSG